MGISSEMTKIFNDISKGNDIHKGIKTPIASFRAGSSSQKSTGGFGVVGTGLDLFSSASKGEIFTLNNAVSSLEGAASLAVIFSANPYLLFGVSAWFVGKALFNAVTKGLPALAQGKVTEAGMVFGKSALDIAFNCHPLKAGAMFGKLKNINTGLFSRAESSIAQLVVSKTDDAVIAGEKLTRTVNALQSEVSQAEKLLEASTQAYKTSQRALRKEYIQALRDLKKTDPTAYGKFKQNFAAKNILTGRRASFEEGMAKLKETYSFQANAVSKQLKTATIIQSETARLAAKEGLGKAAKQAAEETAKKATLRVKDLEKRLADIEAQTVKLKKLTKNMNKVNPSRVAIRTDKGSIKLKELIADRKAALAKAQEAVAIHAKSGITDEVISLHRDALGKTFGLNTSDFAYDLTRLGFGNEQANAAAEMTKGLQHAFRKENIDATVATVKGTVSRVVPQRTATIPTYSINSLPTNLDPLATVAIVA